ncbi:hypothetical protein BURMUCGD2_3363 [Burkholderia multivorans CGD2]|uniref:Uncharacterized protein n=1 Tax=Burkholderia multivorans CGD2 TaxID=513052 RepID=B9BW34_9BURK|nr:hypothetical protein BURMUCGD2_3363 [Burkholderia multivorans CGD2]
MHRVEGSGMRMNVKGTALRARRQRMRGSPPLDMHACCTRPLRAPAYAPDALARNRRRPTGDRV